MKLTDKKIFALICARAGSKGLPNKNIKCLGGTPLIAHSINVAKSVDIIDRVFVSTDGRDIAKVAKDAGAEIPYLRPDNLAQDDSPEWLVWRDMLTYFDSIGEMPDALVVLPPTAPLRSSEDVIGTIERFFGNDCDGVLCGTEARRSPEFNMVRIDASGACELPMKPRTSIARRQDSISFFDVTTVCYVVKPSFVLNQSAIFEGRILLQQVPLERAVDIDTQLDFVWAEFMLNRKNGE